MSHYRSRHHLHLLHPLDALPCDGVDDVADPRAPIAMHRVPQTDDRSRDADHKGREDAGTAAVIGWRVGYGASSRKPKLPLNLLPDEPANLLEELPKRTRTTSATGGRQSSSSLRTPCPSPLSPAGFYVPEVRWSPRLLPAVWAGTHAERTELRPIRLRHLPSSCRCLLSLNRETARFGLRTVRLPSFPAEQAASCWTAGCTGG
jgi:hypothetical protein